jgi:hypothetical protein
MHRAARAAGAEHKRGFTVAPAGEMLVEIRGKSVGVGIAADEDAVFHPERVDGTDRLRRLIAAVCALKCAFLVRDGNIAPSPLAGPDIDRQRAGKSSGATSIAW